MEVGLDDALGTAGTAGTAAGTGAGGSASAGGSTGAAGAPDAQAGTPPCEQTECRGELYDCGNCVDDDQDGLPDARDPDCLGPCDDDESALSTGLVTSQSAACRQDCYFDGNNGPGNDKCLWSFACDAKSLAPDYPPSGDSRCAHDPDGQIMGVSCADLSGVQPQACLDNCLPLVPNGCDCFGCCELPGGSGDFRFIGVGSGPDACSFDTLEDAQACPPCTPVGSCLNECEPCETCVGRAPMAGCEPSSGCPAGQAACQTDAPCDFGEYCVTGCCVRAPEPT